MNWKMPQPGDMIRTKAGLTGVFLRFKSYVHGHNWGFLPGAQLDLGKPIAGKYLIWRCDENEVKQCITGHMQDEVEVISSISESEE